MAGSESHGQFLLLPCVADGASASPHAGVDGHASAPFRFLGAMLPSGYFARFAARRAMLSLSLRRRLHRHRLSLAGDDAASILARPLLCPFGRFKLAFSARQKPLCRALIPALMAMSGRSRLLCFGQDMGDVAGVLICWRRRLPPERVDDGDGWRLLLAVAASIA